MNIARTILPLVVTLAASGMAPSVGHAYVDVELNSGRHVVGQYYTDQGGKLTVYRPSGAIELDRTTVRSIQEPPGDLPSEVGTASDASANDASSVGTSSGQPVKARATDPEARERELAHQLIDVRLNRLAASQRGDDEAMKKLDKQIKTLQGEREGNWKKLHPPDSQASND